MRPIARRRTPGPAPGGTPYFIGRRPRLATCGGVAWFHGHHLATLNLLANAVHTYRFDGSLAPLDAQPVLSGLDQPENLAFSPAGDLLAVTNSLGGAVHLYDVDRATHAIRPAPAATLQCERDAGPHGVAFSPGGRLLLFSTVNQPSGLRLHRLAPGLPGVHALPNRFAPLKPKGVAFSPDERFVAIAYGPNARNHPHDPENNGLLAIHRLEGDALSVDPIAVRGGIGCAEDVSFHPGGGSLVVTDQAGDCAMILRFADGEPGPPERAVEDVRFPHGNAISDDGRFLAVASYGDNEVSVYELPPPSVR